MNHACILHVEDDSNDVLLLEYAFKTAGVDNPVQVASNGQQAIDYLLAATRAEEPWVHPMPCLVLLDLKLPVKSGLDVLRWARQQPGLSGLPVIVLTSSRDPIDILQSYRLGANSFVVKPFAQEQRVRLARAIKFWWIEHNLCSETWGDSVEKPTQRAICG
ncbi:MAG TPA: response regulator [Verrucomicrobiae bacterium]|nr:response regulator [Verrucomicrobiae bacterium]